jgi:plastocyanin
MKRLALVVAVVSTMVAVMPGPSATATFPTVDIEEYRYLPRKERAPLGGDLLWYNAGSLTHTATQDARLRFFNTGQLAPGATSGGVTMWAAGRFPYHCNIHPNLMRGLVKVPVNASAGAIGLGESVTIEMSSVFGFKGYTFDLQRKRNKGPWVLVREGVGSPSVDLTPKRTGRFRFRARVEKLNGARSGWSPAAEVIVGDV